VAWCIILGEKGRNQIDIQISCGHFHGSRWNDDKPWNDTCSSKQPVTQGVCHHVREAAALFGQYVHSTPTGFEDMPSFRSISCLCIDVKPNPFVFSEYQISGNLGLFVSISTSLFMQKGCFNPLNAHETIICPMCCANSVIPVGHVHRRRNRLWPESC